MVGAYSLGVALRGQDFGSNVVITVKDDDDEIVVSGARDIRPQSKPIVYRQGKDFAFSDNQVVFTERLSIFAPESLSVGLFKESMQWRLDKFGRLVVVSGGYSVGTVLVVVPVLAGGTTVSIFERAMAETNQSPVPTPGVVTLPATQSP